MASLGKRMVRAASFQVLGNLSRVVLGMVASVLMVRWLGPEEFGKASWLVSLTLYISVLASGGIGIPFVRSLTQARLTGDRRGSLRLVGRLWLIRFLVSGLVLALCLGIKMAFAPQLDRIPGGELLLFVPLMLLVSFLHGNLIRLLQVHFRPGLVSLLAAVEIIAKIGLLKYLGGGNPDALTLVMAAIGSEAVALVGATLAGGRILWQMQPASESTPDHKPIPGIKSMLITGRPVWMLSIAQRILGRDVDVLLLGLLAGPVEVARYTLSFTLATIGLSLASSAFQSTTAISAFSESDTTGTPEARGRLMKAMLEYWLVFITPIGVGGILLGGRMLHILYGDAAEGTGPVVALLFAAFCLGELASLGKDALHGMGQDHRPARAHWAGGMVNLVGSLFLIPRMGAQGAALATLLATIIVTTVQFRFLLSYLCCSPRLRSLVAGGTALGALSVSIFFADNLAPGQADSLVHLTFTILGAGTAYLATLALIGPHTSLRDGCQRGPFALRLARRIL